MAHIITPELLQYIGKRTNTHMVYDLYDLSQNIPYVYMTFPGGEPHVKLNVSKFSNKFLWIYARITDMASFGELIVLTDAIRRCGVNRLGLFCPYFPGARQDRATEGTPFTLKLYADIINNLNYDLTVVVDPHSDVLPAVLNKCKVIKPGEILISGKVEDYDYLVCPDAGAEKRTHDIAAHLGIDQIIYGRKHRDVVTGRLNGFSVSEQPRPGTFGLVVDDICDGGGTFIGLAQQLPEAKLSLYVTHGIFSKGTEELFKYFRDIITTDSWYQTNQKIHTIELFNLGSSSMRKLAQ